MESAPSDARLQCPTCRNALQVNREITDLDEQCPVCGAKVHLAVFPRLYRELEESPARRVAGEEEAKCNFYPDLPAEKVCDECGSFLSSRAAVRWGDLDLCLPCLHRLRETEKSASFVARGKLHDNRALALVTLLAPFTLFTAPIALVILLRHRHDPGGFEPRSRVKWWISLCLAVGWLGVWAVLIAVWMSLILDDFS